tara:strand:- start:6281 stop:6721 length:441 start_codon:yes stop_codon:yes gene_type:complete
VHLLLINGPNLNLLGNRETEIYGSETLESIERSLKEQAIKEDIQLTCFQSNSEGEIVDQIHESENKIDGILINAGAYTHTSIAIRDALLSVAIPFVELHLSNTFAREDFRKKSFISDKAIGLVCGFGVISYPLAMEGLLAYLRKNN